MGKSTVANVRTTVAKQTLNPLLIFLAAQLVGAPSTFAQDRLFQEQQGEINFQQEQETPVPERLTPQFDEEIQSATEQRSNNLKNLERLEAEHLSASERQVGLQEESEQLAREREALVDKLIATARNIQTLEDDIQLTERRIGVLNRDEALLKNRLEGQRGILSEVLAALQKIGRNPPPALFVSTDDALTTVRSAIVLGAIVPDLREKANELFDTLAELGRIRENVAEEANTLQQEEASLKQQQAELDGLIKENKALKEKTDRDLAKEEQTVRLIAAQAENLRDLITKIDANISKSKQAKFQAVINARNEALARQREKDQASAAIQRQIASLSPIEDPAPAARVEGHAIAAIDSRLVDYSQVDIGVFDDVQTSNTPFVDTKGQLRKPARGVTLTQYGSQDDYGNRSQGLTIATRANAPVIAPVAGKVVFSGPFRTFRQLLILDVGDRYHMLLAGMEEIDVSIGDIVQPGEPIGRMGDARLSAQSAAINSDSSGSGLNFLSSKTQSLLYVEVRQDGKSINSASWWAD